MMKLLYQTDSYLNEFPATVIAVDPTQNAVALDRSAFYPGGGGQPNDTGVLVVDREDLAVTKVRRDGEHLWHVLDSSAALPECGQQVIGRIDWQRRYALMRTHTALHILCGVVWRDYGAQVTGGNMDPLEGRMDFEFATLRAELVGEIEASATPRSRMARDVRVEILPRSRRFRFPT